MSKKRKLIQEKTIGGIAIYSRVSTENQLRNDRSGTGGGPTGSSLETQTERCYQWILSRYPELSKADIQVFQDEGKSAKDLNRPEFQRLIRGVKMGLVQHIVFTDLARISRNLRDFLDLIDLFNAHEVSLTSLKEAIDTSTASGRMIVSILLSLSQFEREQTGERVKINMRSRAERGLFNGGNVPFGYVSDPERSGYLIPDPDAARIVQTIYRTFLNEGSSRSALIKLRELGIRRPGWTAKKSGKYHEGGWFTQSTLINILRSPVYIGLREINRENKGLSDEEIQALSEEMRYRTETAVWDPIIDRDIWNAVQNRLESNKNSTRNAGKRKFNYPLSGILRCPECGAPYFGAASSKKSKDGKPYIYYKHSGQVGADCNKTLRAEPIENAVRDHLSDIFNRPTAAEELYQRIQAAVDKETPKLLADLSATEERVHRLESQQKAAFGKLMVFGDDVPQSFLSFVREAEADLDAAKQERMKIQSDLEGARRRALDRDKFMAGLSRLAEKWDTMKPGVHAFFLRYVRGVYLSYEGELIIQVHGVTLDVDGDKKKRRNALEDVSSIELSGSPART